MHINAAHSPYAFLLGAQADLGERLGGIRDAYAEAGFSEDFTSFKIRTGAFKAGKAQ